MLTDSQKKSVFVALKKSFTIEGTNFNMQTIYENQKLSAYPTAILKYIDEGGKSVSTIGNRTSAATIGQRSLAHLSVNIYARDDAYSGLNAYQIANGIARALLLDINTNWKSLASDTVRFADMSNVRNLTGLIEQETSDVQLARLQFDIVLKYTIEY